MSVLDRVLGPRIPKDEMRANGGVYRVPLRLLTGAAILLLVSLLLPYWVLNLKAPQYPDGLTVSAYVNHLEGDVDELEGLNHYVGLGSFEDVAVFERSIAVYAIVGLVALLLAGLFIHSRWVLVLTVPAMTFPLVFLMTLQYHLYQFGHDLNPAAPFNLDEFTPPFFGPAEIAQFNTLALPGPGLILAFVASGLIAYAMVLHRRAYKPLLEAMSEGG